MKGFEQALVVKQVSQNIKSFSYRPVSSADPEGGTGGPDSPLENHKLYGFL